MRTLYDLAGAQDDRRFSPYCWRTKFALAHKRLAVDTVPWRFTDKEAIAFSGQGRVPVLVDEGRVIVDSWTIATYLEETYPQHPSLFGAPAAIAVTRFINAWTDAVVSPAIVRMILTDVFAHLHEKDKAHFRTTREERFGRALEEVSADRQTQVVAFRKMLEPLRTVLGRQPYLAGEAPLYADYIVFGQFQWARCVSPFRLLLADDPVALWRERMLHALDAMALKAPGYPV